MENENPFDDFEKEISKSINDVPESDKIASQEIERVDEWKKKRIGKITSSVLPKLMNFDKFGHIKTKAGIDYLLETMHQRGTGEDEQVAYAKAMEWGHTYEEEALDYYNKITGNNVISGTYGDGPILFREPLEGFGDSPDGVTEDECGVVEIKCPYNGANHLRNCALNSYHDGCDYFWQIIGHMVYDKVKWCDFVSYDPRYEDGDPLKIKIIRINREDVQSRIDELTAKIIYWNQLINEGDIAKIIEEA